MRFCLPIWHGVLHTKGRSRGGRILPNNHAIALHQCGQCRRAGRMQGRLTSAQTTKSKKAKRYAGARSSMCRRFRTVTKLRLEWYGGVVLLLQRRSKHPREMVLTSRRPLPVSPRPPSGIDTTRCWARQCRRTGETHVFCTSVCVCVPLDVAVIPVTWSLL